MKSIQIPFEEKVINAILDEASAPKALLILAHGAGAGMTHTFMDSLATMLQKKDLSVLRFNFPYIDQGRKAPGSPKTNISAWLHVVQWAEEKFPLPIILSGKSYGGRMASHLLSEETYPKVKGIIYFGFPLHAPGKNTKDRASHLPKITVPQLFLQGTKDTLAHITLMEEVCSELKLSTLIQFENADHSFKTKGQKIEDVIDQLASQSTHWIEKTITKN